MHLAQVHSPNSFVSSAPTTSLYSSFVANKNAILAFLVGTLLGLVVAMSFFSVSPHQFHTDISQLNQEEITSKLMSLPQAQKRKVLQDVFSAKYSSSQSSNQQQQKKKEIPPTTTTTDTTKNSDFFQDEQEKINNKPFFPLFEPVPKKPAKILSLITRSIWAEVDVRAVEADFGKSATEVLAENQKPKKKKSSSSLLSWTWINVRPHINALPALTKNEILNIWPSETFLKKATTLRAASRLFSSSSSKTSNQKQQQQQKHDEDDNDKSFHFFPVFLQTKYSYRGDSIAVVGGLFEPSTDKSLRQTAIRELREELGIVCSTVVSHGRFVNDANRGCGNFESFFAKNCRRTAQSVGDKAAQDSESQQLLILTREDLIELLANTRQLAKLTEFPYANDEEPYDFATNNQSHFMMNVKKKYFQDSGKERQDLENDAGSGHSLNHGLVLKETKWISTISMTLLALEQKIIE